MPKKIKLTYSKERVILSDMLPYEAPVSFSNRKLYDFLIKNELHYLDGKFYWKHVNNTLDFMIKTLLGIPNKSINKNSNYSFVDSSLATIPFVFAISHKTNQLRQLSVMHPSVQIAFIDFYNKYRDLIIYYSSKSSFSLRYPNKIAKCFFWQSNMKITYSDNEDGIIEEFNNEYKNLRSYFVYEKYNNIHKFYDSDIFHRYEMKFRKLAKLDITKCFDSIYSHSIAWAILGKDNVKKVLYSDYSKFKDTFSNKFDILMQDANNKETNGILIGPEISRIFSEIILQQVDKNLEMKLASIQKFKNIDYQISRYVDDYFVFFNDDKLYDFIAQELQIYLKEYKLSLNSQKQEIYERPIITKISVAKKFISKLFNENINYPLKKEHLITGESFPSFHINHNFLITEFKTIIHQSDVSYIDILNYSFSILERKCLMFFKKYRSIFSALDSQQKEKQERLMTKGIISFLTFLFFIYSSSPKVNTTIKLARIISIIIKQLNTFEPEARHNISIFIFEQICSLLECNSISRNNQIETLYLLLILSELKSKYWLNNELLYKYLSISNRSKNIVFEYELNYFTITIILLYIKNKSRFGDIKKALLKNITDRVNNYQDKELDIFKNTEFTLMFFDLMSCPYLKDTEKKKLFEVYFPFTKLPFNFFENNITLSFTDWENFNFAKELDSKRSFEVY